jgi:hypothetical protein
MGCGINRRDAFSYTLAMTAIAAYPNRYDDAKALLAQRGYDDVSIAALDSVRRNHADEIASIRKEIAVDLVLAHAGDIGHDHLTVRLVNVALRHAAGYLENNPAADPLICLRRAWRLQMDVLQKLADLGVVELERHNLKRL